MQTAGLALAGLVRSSNYRQLNKALLAGCVVNPLYRLLVVARLGPEDALHERLWIAVVERKPARLHLHHDSMARQEDVVSVGQRELVQQRRVGGNRFSSGEALAIAATQNTGRDHQF